MTETIDQLMTALAGRYEIERELGAGGMATVYLARDIKHDRNVAVKVLRPELAAVIGAERFLNEIKVTANLQHPHILQLYDSGEADSFLYYVMPFIDGESLRDKLDREKQLSVDDAVEITKAVASALDYAHRQEIVHRDIKPANILLVDGQPVVADFGIALAVSAAGGTRITETGLSLGTPHYMSPEQATGDRDLDARSDVYSLGAVAYEMLTGEPPHIGNTVQAIVAKIITSEPELATKQRNTIPPHVSSAVHQALAKLPADRFSTAAKFAEALSDTSFTATAVIGGATPQSGSANWRQRFAIPLAVLAALLFMTTTWALTRPDPPKPVSRYGISLPEDQALLGEVAISPDGALWAWVGPSETGTQLWLKKRHEHNATPVPGTLGAVAPFFSPNSQSLGFIANNEVKTVPVSGGPATTIGTSAATSPISSATWMDDGRIAFVDMSYAVVIVPSEGGQQEVVYRAPPSERYGGVAGVASLPGSDGLIMRLCAANCELSALWALNLGSMTITPLVEAANHSVYASTGHLLYVTQDASLFAVPFDAKSLEITGPPISILNGINSATLSESGDLIYTVSSGTAINTLVWVDRVGNVQVVDSSFSGGNTVALSPDGSRLAVSTSGEAGQDIWIKQLDTGPASRLTFPDGSDHRPTWTPDGLSITFISERGENRDLYMKRADGVGTATLLLDYPKPVNQGFWTPDGEWLVFRLGRIVLNEDADIFARRAPPDTTTLALMAETGINEHSPDISADGRWITYVSDETGRPEVFVRPFPDVAAGKWQISAQGGTEPRWAHSGQELFYKDGQNMIAVSVETTSAFLLGESRALFPIANYNNYEYHARYDVSLDDQRFILLRAATASSRGLPLVLVENFIEELKATRGGS